MTAAKQAKITRPTRKRAPRRAPLADLAQPSGGGISADRILERFDRYLIRATLDAVAAHTSVSAIELVSGLRSWRVARARGYLVHALRSRGWSWSDIAALLDRDHSGLMHAARRVASETDLPRLLASVSGPVTT
jgi:hypothetical protein